MVVDVLVCTFTESVAVQVTVETLRQIDSNEDADALREITVYSCCSVDSSQMLLPWKKILNISYLKASI